MPGAILCFPGGFMILSEVPEIRYRDVFTLLWQNKILSGGIKILSGEIKFFPGSLAASPGKGRA